MNPNNLPIPVSKASHNFLTNVIGRFLHGSKLSTVKNAEALEDDRFSTFDDLVFEKRNQDYGAYVLRKSYSQNVWTGLVLTMAFVFIVIFFPAVVQFFKGSKAVVHAPTKKVVYSELSAPPPIDKVKPPPPAIQLPRLQKVIKFVPPKVVKEQVIEEIPTIKELREHESAAIAVDGADDVVFDEPVADVVEDDSNEIFAVVEQQPEFEGGYEAMMQFIKQNMRYPASARRMQIDGTVHVSFLVSKTGSISEVKVLRGIQSECDKEAVRVIEMMPAWKPGKQNGKPVTVRFIMPIKFRLND
jgi:protein TonB